MMKWLQFSLIILLMFFLVSGIANSAYVSEYIDTMKQKQVFADRSLEEIIRQYAKEHDVPAIEPKVDPVWKLIPGYNGLAVDTEATLFFAKMHAVKSLDQIPFMWKEVEPATKIDQLGAYPIYRGNPNKPQVSLMINVAWGTEYLEAILTALRNEHVKATFFLDGSWLKRHPQLAKKIAQEGHEIGNHAYSHPQMSRLTEKRIKEEIVRTEKLIQSITNQSSQYFAPPSGDYDQRVVKIAKELHLQTVLWTLDTIDWKKPSPETIIQRIIPKADNGHLILMHPTESSANALPQLIKKIKEKGLKIAPVKDTLSTKRILQVEAPKFF